MRTTLHVFLCFLLFQFSGTDCFAFYKETLSSSGVVKKLRKDYGLVNDNGQKDQSAIFQKAIDEVSAAGGGKIIVEKGTYKLADVYLKSNVHLFIKAGTVLKPNWPAGEKVAVFILDADWNAYKKNKRAFIQNVSVRGDGGQFVVDYHNRVRKDGEGCRAIEMRMVRNFLVENMDVKDNYTTYCGMVMSPSKDDDLNVSGWEVSRPTKGTVQQCRIFRASPGYGLIQFHGANKVACNDMYAEGGVTLRFETGANNGNVGVFDVYGKNIVNEKGRSAAMFGPHSAKNGKVIIDGVKSIGSTYAVEALMGGVKAGAPDQTPGYFAAGTKVKNIHAIHGEEAQIKNQEMLMIPEAYKNKLKLWPDNKFLDGPSIAAVKDDSETYDIEFRNITKNGFSYYKNKSIVSHNDGRSGNVWDEWDEWTSTHNKAKYKTNKGAVVTSYTIPPITTWTKSASLSTLAMPSVLVEETESVSVVAYPNPATELLTLSGLQLGNRTNCSIAVYSILGAKVMEQRVGNEQTQIDLTVSGLSAGTYVLRLVGNNEVVYSTKFVKQ